MQVHSEKVEPSQEEKIRELQRQVDELTASNLLLQEQLTRKDQFMAMIAHDLRGPLSPIINYAQMLARSTRSNGSEDAKTRAHKEAALQRQTSIIISQARRMSRLVNDLLDISRLASQSQQFKLVRGECDIITLTNEMVDQLRPLAPYHTFVVNAPSEKIVGRWDRGRLQQVLGNLLDNAIKYSDEHTAITITIVQREQCVAVSVNNQGPGIPSTEIGQLFRPYTRLAATSDREGSGLGLFITKSIIDAHGGTLRLEPYNDEAGSSETTRGTTFTFELPL